ncbi:MAG: hypothetical protein CVU56_10375 [Deltaproteobacteria bacterium HGW-Deltaproteobacteria-14]|jgi:uncharacterized protein YdeI (YjbR/CyaY-like superfamily)|nr:MAG: hypothetical protein CVU56_10375 [Deltaproteobacteria bacterium HGW-Deltaproteobacteria-14]
MNTTSVDAYLADGCGRCDQYQTPQCKVHLWTSALVELRALLVASGLSEEMKWGSPCYTLDGKNVVMLTSFKDHCALSFFKGVLLADERGVLAAPGPNSQAMRLFKFTSRDEVRAQRELVVRYLEEAIALERAGATVTFAASPEPMPAELSAQLAADPALSAAFDALTPGRRRSYILHVSGAKQAKTRAARAERCVPLILAGKGFNER